MSSDKEFSIVTYRAPSGPRVAVRHIDGSLVDVAHAARSRSSEHPELAPFEDSSDLQQMLVDGLDLDALSILTSMATDGLDADTLLMADEVRYETPIMRPGKIIGVGLNVPGLVGGPVPPVAEMPYAAPFWFTKVSTAVVGHNQPIIHPGKGHTTRLIPEPELAMIIGKRCGPGIAAPKAEDAAEYIAGWSICNDVSALDIEFDRGGAPFAYNLTWSKSYPTFAPVGPWMTRIPAEAVNDLDISMQVNGEIICEYNTSDMLWSPFELLEYFAAVLILEPGDVISCGNAPPVKIIEPGDRVDIDVVRIGRMTNTVTGAAQETSYRIPQKVVNFARDYRERPA